jgi:hypothetical protein
MTCIFFLVCSQLQRHGNETSRRQGHGKKETGSVQLKDEVILLK